VSVVMPYLNVAAYLGAAIESVRAQGYRHWELLLVDDGATDGSGAIAAGYAAREPGRVRRLAHPGGGTRGASAARNLGLRHARGAYVALLDGDDVWLPHKLGEQVALLEATPGAAVLVGATEYWYGWTGRPEDAARDHVVRVGLPHGSLVEPPTLLRRILEEEVAVPCTCSLIARREAVEGAGGFEAAFRRVFTDQAFYAKLFLRAPVLVVDTCWDRYRLHAASSVASAERAGEVAAARLQWLRWVGEYLDAHDVRDPALRAALRRALWRMRHPRAARLIRRVRRVLRTVRA
jgi:cellulose synthase/poly-beta-1,6-N-acetylglucosamine synthase-like glycosyltransferase